MRYQPVQGTNLGARPRFPSSNQELVCGGNNHVVHELTVPIAAGRGAATAERQCAVNSFRAARGFWHPRLLWSAEQ
jgi:hypothetical protein